MKLPQANLKYLRLIQFNISKSYTAKLLTTLSSSKEGAGAVMSWFSSPVYSRYWQHYHQAMYWQQRHRHAYLKALEAVYGFGYHPEQLSGIPQRYGDWHSEESDSGDEAQNEDSNSDSEIECDVSNMEISDELRQYFAQTERHREELSKTTLIVLSV